MSHNLAARTKEERERINVDLAASGGGLQRASEPDSDPKRGRTATTCRAQGIF